MIDASENKIREFIKCKQLNLIFISLTSKIIGKGNDRSSTIFGNFIVFI